MIKINSLNKYFNRGKQNEIHVLNNISLDLPERGMVAVFGRSGCGKTTLLNVIGGLDSYLSGSVEINGKKISSDTDSLRNRHIGYIFQNYNLNTGVNCYDNVADALRLCGMSDKKNADEIQKRTMSALAAVGMAHYAARYPDTLSGGQKQRIAIARAIVKSPDIILADEPTGNLDETNTVMIMDILREIAQTRLVLLVTHESNLVDSYCDRVIGITDGRITSVKENDISSGYAVKNKNHIYLGEFEKTGAETGTLSIDYYGEPAEGKVKLTIVNDGGRIFLRVDTPGVHIIDDYGETKLHEGVFEKTDNNESKKRLDLSLLSPFEGKRYGKLFTFFASLKSGSRILAGKKIKRGRKVLKARNFLAGAYLICFALVFTLLISYCASGIAVFGNTESETNLNTFYILLKDIDEEKLGEAVSREEACIDFINTIQYLVMDGEYIRLSTGVFETFRHTNYNAYAASMPYLPHSLLKDKKVISGSVDDLNENDIVLSDIAADAILKTGTFDYISDYNELIGCELAGNDDYYAPEVSIKTEKYRIAAVVQTGELAAYACESTLGSLLENNSRLAVWRASDLGIELKKGEALVADRVGADYTPKEGEEFKVSGVTLAASASENTQEIYYDYYSWIIGNGYEERSESEHYYDSLERYYSHLHEYAIYHLLAGQQMPWVVSYFIGGNEDAIYLAAGDLEYYAACKYRNENGSLPAERMSTSEIDKYSASYYALEKECSLFSDYAQYDNQMFYSPTAVFVSDEDYRATRFGFGETDPVAIKDYYYIFMDKYSYDQSYLVLHSYDPDATEAYLRSVFPQLPENNIQSSEFEFITPELRLMMAIEENKIEIIASLIALGIGLVLMCICIYFIMRSSMLSKVREIGIYRAVGVSKKNLLFKFAVESTAIALQTLVIGFAIGAYFANSLSGGVTATSFYFPFWLAALTLAMLIGTCVLFGILPIASLLRKTPAQILAKYDI